MRIMMPVNEDRKTICISFGRTPLYMIVDSEKNERRFVENPGAEASGGAGIKAAQLIVDEGADILLTPRCGENAVEVLNGADIKIYKTESNDIEEELEKFEKGELGILTEIHKGLHHK